MQIGQTKQGFKVCTLGSHSVGKTAIIHRFSKGIFAASPLPTIDLSLTTQAVIVDGKSVKLNIWDTAGQERYKSTVPIYMRDVQCIILVFDVTAPESWDVTKEWIETQLSTFEEKPLIVICGNKDDLQATVSSEEVTNWCNDNAFSVFFTSALTSKGIKEMFTFIAKTLSEKFPHEVDKSQSAFAMSNNEKCSC